MQYASYFIPSRRGELPSPLGLYDLHYLDRVDWLGYLLLAPELKSVNRINMEGPSYSNDLIRRGGINTLDMEGPSYSIRGLHLQII